MRGHPPYSPYRVTARGHQPTRYLSHASAYPRRHDAPPPGREDDRPGSHSISHRNSLAATVTLPWTTNPRRCRQPIVPDREAGVEITAGRRPFWASSAAAAAIKQSCRLSHGTDTHSSPKPKSKITGARRHPRASGSPGRVLISPPPTTCLPVCLVCSRCRWPCCHDRGREREREREAAVLAAARRPQPAAGEFARIPSN
jgi:hypothetical protein